MNGWMRTDFDFGNPMRWLQVDHRDVTVWNNVKEIVNSHSDDPETLRAMLQSFVTGQRPDLFGGSVLAFRMSTVGGFCWEILYCHPSFKPSDLWNDIQRLALAPPGYVQVPGGPDEPVRFEKLADRCGPLPRIGDVYPDANWSPHPTVHDEPDPPTVR